MCYSGREGVDRTGSAAFLSSTPYLAQEVRLMAVGLHIFFKGHRFGWVQMQGYLEDLGCGVNMIKTYMKFSKKKIKKNKKQTKSSFLCLTPVLPKGVSISVAFFTVVHTGHWRFRLWLRRSG